MRLLCNIQTPTSGKIVLNGKNIVGIGEKYRNLLGYLPQHFGYYPDFTALDFLLYVSALKGLNEKSAKKKSKELLGAVGLSAESRHKIKTFSGGMIRRIGIAQALLNDPEILVLDEPTSGLDPGERVRFRNIISSLGKNRLVLLSTHIVSDVEYIADKILLMKDGSLLHVGDESLLLSKAAGCVWKCLVPEAQVELLERQHLIGNLRHHGPEVELRIISAEKPWPEAEPAEVTLEDAYLYCIKYTGRRR